MKRTFSLLLYAIGKYIGFEDGIPSILCYHSVGDNNENLTVPVKKCIQQIQKIMKYATIVPLQELSHKSAKNQIALTFDDGYKDIHLLLPFLTKHHIPVTLFVLSDIEHRNKTQIANNIPILSDNELKTIANLPNVCIGSHSATHANLVLLHGKELVNEILGSKHKLEDKLRKKILFFAYPNGAYNDEVMQAVKSAGYESAYTIECNPNMRNIFEIPRIVVNKHHTLEEFPALHSRTIRTLRSLIAL